MLHEERDVRSSSELVMDLYTIALPICGIDSLLQGWCTTVGAHDQFGYLQRSSSACLRCLVRASWSFLLSNHGWDLQWSTGEESFVI